MSVAGSAAGDIARWAHTLRADDVPASARDAAALHMLDGLAVAIAAARRHEGAAGAAIAPAGDEATVLGSGARTDAAHAALANGMLVHALDLDDTHTAALCHPTAVVLPAVLAAAEATGAAGAEAILAALAGYETIVRLGRAAPHAFHARGFHATSVCGVFAAALSASLLFGLGEDATVHALGIAGSFASGSLEFLHTASTTKQIHPGWAAHGGVTAARLAAAGAEGPDSILEGGYGIFRAYADRALTREALTAGLGDVWEIEATSIKPYPACQLSHASLDALASVRDRALERPADSIVFDVPGDAVPIVCEPAADKERPRTPYEAKFSLAWCAAALLVDGRLTPETFDDPDRPDVTALAARVGYRVTDPGVPAADAAGRVEIRHTDGTITESAAPGGGRRATREAVLGKASSLGCPRPLVDAVLSLGDASSVRAILDAATLAGAR